MKPIFLFISLFCFASIASANPSYPTNDLISEYDAVYLTKTQKVFPVQKQESEPTLHYNVTATYPQIAGKTLSLSEQAFNQQVLQIVNDEIQQFKNRVKRDAPSVQALPKEVQNNSFKIDYDLDVIHPLSLISVRLSMEGMQAGRAHPYHTHRVLNYDLAHNKVLVLSDLFKPDSNYLEAIARFSHKKLDTTVDQKDKWMIKEGAKAIANNYKNWNIEKDAILITFDEYQVAPYVYGAQEVEIPYSELQNLLSTQAKVISSIKDDSKSPTLALK